MVPASRISSLHDLHYLIFGSGGRVASIREQPWQEPWNEGSCRTLVLRIGSGFDSLIGSYTSHICTVQYTVHSWLFNVLRASVSRTSSLLDFPRPRLALHGLEAGGSCGMPGGRNAEGKVLWRRDCNQVTTTTTLTVSLSTLRPPDCDLPTRYPFLRVRCNIGSFSMIMAGRSKPLWRCS